MLKHLSPHFPAEHGLELAHYISLPDVCINFVLRALRLSAANFLTRPHRPPLTTKALPSASDSEPSSITLVLARAAARIFRAALAS